MKTKKTPMRMCIGCREMKPKRELVRLVAGEDGTVFLDETSRAPGRGAYICPSSPCLERAVKARAVEHALSKPLNASSLETLRARFEGNSNE